jgi:hypothetical protein
VLARAVGDGHGNVALEAEAAGFLVEPHAVVLEVGEQRLVERPAFEGRRRRRHLEPREDLAVQPDPHDVDGAQRLGAAIRFDRAVEHRRGPFPDCARRGFPCLSADAMVAAATRTRATADRSMAALP